MPDIPGLLFESHQIERTIVTFQIGDFLTDTMFALLLPFSLSAISTATCYIRDGTLSITDNILDTSGAAWGSWDDSIFDIGWFRFHVEGNPAVPEPDLMRCAGAIEGYLSQGAIFNHFRAILQQQHWNESGTLYPDGWELFLQANIDFLNESINAYLDLPYWQTSGLVFTQFTGLVEGYDLKISRTGLHNESMSLIDQWVVQSEGDIDDVAHVISKYAQNTPSGPTVDLTEDNMESEHCTAVIKLTKDFSDIYFAHDSWANYLDLFGVLKDYRLPVRSFVAHQVVMSTRPGKLSSYDDFYMADSGLFVMETTMSVFNTSLFEYIKPQVIFTWFRAIHTTWTSHNGAEWTTNFIRHNSGTYNNQYMVIDSNKFTRFEKPTTDLLWIIEQYPGPHWLRADVTAKLVADGYWPSINKPSFKALFDIAGYPQKIASVGATGDYDEYEGTSRYLIIQREAPRLDDFEIFKKFMRYNNWRRDLYSNGDAVQQIMARTDLRRYKNPYGAAKLHGGLDSKAAKVSEGVTKLAFHAIASPAHDNGNPPWSFEKSSFNITDHRGLPDTWTFDDRGWNVFAGKGVAACARFATKGDCIGKQFCGWCGGSKKCLAGDDDGTFEVEEKCESGWTLKSGLPDAALGGIVAAVVIVVVLALVLPVCISRRRRQ
jgi:hypothetical protein